MMNAMEPITLNTGAKMPRIGLGVFRAAPDQTMHAVSAALAAGYRHIDTAQIYGNEEAVGRAIQSSGLGKGQVFVTTKVAPANMAPSRIVTSIAASINALGFIPDLLLLHWPQPDHRLSAWRALEEMQLDGRLPAIGVSNFMERHLREVIDNARVIPAVNQIELSPFLQQRQVREICNGAGIVVAAYSPLTKGMRLGHPALSRIAAKHGVTPAQILLAWGIGCGAAVLPKSVRPERIVENITISDLRLDAADMAVLNGLEENLVTGWNPQTIE
jgi:diketogulonate reductase-like aldo/keto reductase